MTDIKADSIVIKSANGSTTFQTITANGVASAVGDIKSYTAGENVAPGNVCYLKPADGKMWKAQANAEATTKGTLGLALETKSAEAACLFLLNGYYTTTGLTAGDIFLSDTAAGGILTTAPDSDGDQVRIIGMNESTTVLHFDPDRIYCEVEVA